MGYKLKRILIYPDGVTEKQVYPAGWRPNANTLAYYPLESDGNDYSGNGHNLTWNSTPSYGVSGGTKSVANLGGDKLGKISNLSGIYTNYTINVWCKPTATTSWQEIFDSYHYFSNYAQNTAYFTYPNSNQDFFYQYRPNGGTNAYQVVNGTTNRAINIWYNVCLTSTSSGVKIYVNGTQSASNSTTGAIVLESGYNSVGGRYAHNEATQNQNFFSGYLSEFIFENKTRTAEEISKYYNLTKANYGL